MYQTPLISATTVSRIAGPVCITRLAIRPAKSFWKNAQDWRTTCQWFCQRMRFDTLAVIAWLDSRFCAVSASGRTSTSATAMASSIGQCSANSASGLSPVTSVTTRPMKIGTSVSSSATVKPAANSAMNSPLAWRV